MANKDYENRMVVNGMARYPRLPMRTGILGFSLTVVALLSFPAKAQYANRSLGIGAGYSRINADAQVEWALPFTLEGSLYIEDGFEVYAHVPLMIMFERATGLPLVAFGVDVGARYLFLEETFRPYVGVQGGFLYINRDNGQSKVLFGPGAALGFDYFVADTVSIGPRGFFNLYIALGQPLRWSYGASASVNFYF